MPAMPGTITSRSAWSELKIAPNSARNSSGSRKLKKAALGLRQNILRSSRNWRHERAAKLWEAAPSAIGRQLQVDVLERRPCHAQALEALARRECSRRQLVQQRRRVVRLALVEQSRAVAPGDAVAHRAVAAAELGRRSLGEDPPVLDDRDAVGERLRLVQVVRRQHDGLAKRLQRADRVPRATPCGGVEAGGR